MDFIACQSERRMIDLSCTYMKTLTFILSLVAIPAMSAVAFAQATPGALTGYLPTDTLLQGRAVRAVQSEEMMPLLKAVEAKFAKLSVETKKELLEKRNMERALDYSPKLWDSKADYDTYVEIWGDTKLVERENVAIGLRPTKGNPDLWTVISVTIDGKGKTLPLTIGALQYNSKDNAWISNNGILTVAPFNEDKKYIYGAQRGFVWTLNKEDMLSAQLETVRIAKTKDGKYIFINYKFVEASKSSGKIIAQGGYALRFPVVVAGANVATPGQR